MPNYAAIRGIKMEIGSKYTPLPEVLMPEIRIPPLSVYSYNFRKDKEFLNATQTPRSVESESPVSKAPEPPKSLPTETQVATPVAIPMPLDYSSPARTTVTHLQQSDHHFAEFERQGNVFDQMELMSIDDRSALAELLGS